MNTSSKKILVTGVAGFLGSHLAEKLSELNYEVVGVDDMSGGYKDNVTKNVKFLVYSLTFNKKKKIYYQRLSGLINAIIGKRSWYRPNV